MSEEVRERKRTVNDNIWFFLAEFLEKWNCHLLSKRSHGEAEFRNADSVSGHPKSEIHVSILVKI